MLISFQEECSFVNDVEMESFKKKRFVTTEHSLITKAVIKSVLDLDMVGTAQKKMGQASVQLYVETDTLLGMRDVTMESLLMRIVLIAQDVIRFVTIRCLISIV